MCCRWFEQRHVTPFNPYGRTKEGVAFRTNLDAWFYSTMPSCSFSLLSRSPSLSLSLTHTHTHTLSLSLSLTHTHTGLSGLVCLSAWSGLVCLSAWSGLVWSVCLVWSGCLSGLSVWSVCLSVCLSVYVWSVWSGLVLLGMQYLCVSLGLAAERALPTSIVPPSTYACLFMLTHACTPHHLHHVSSPLVIVHVHMYSVHCIARLPSTPPTAQGAPAQQQGYPTARLSSPLVIVH